MSSDSLPARPYRGVPHDERRAQRRVQLIEAAIAVYGEHGYRLATVKRVCEAAGLTERYFYESFGNSEELLIASYNAVTYAVLDEVVAAGLAAGNHPVARAQAMLHTYFAALQREPLSARVFLVEIRGVSRAVDKAFDASLRVIGKRVMTLIAPSQVAADPLLEAGMIGGVIHIALRWIEDDYMPPINAAVASALRVGMMLPNPLTDEKTA
jgi:AcrR family transcriptional regulator